RLARCLSTSALAAGATPLSLHDALPIFSPSVGRMASASERATLSVGPPAAKGTIILMGRSGYSAWAAPAAKSAPVVNSTDSVRRSEEHTSELQSRENLVCRLLLEKKKKQ